MIPSLAVGSGVAGALRMFTLMSLYLKYMVGINVLLIHSVFILLYIVVALIKVPNPVRNYFTNLEDTTQSTSVKSILIIMLIIYILSFLMNLHIAFQ